MQRILFLLFGLAVVAVGLSEASAELSGEDNGLPKVDYQIGRIQPVGQGLAIPITNGGFVISPNTTVSVAIHDLKSRQLLMTKSLSVPAIQPGQKRRIIFVPPSGRAIMVRAVVDPGNKVRESNERNNVSASRH